MSDLDSLPAPPAAGVSLASILTSFIGYSDLIVISIRIYLAADDGDYLLMCLLPICISCPVKCLLISFADLQIDLFL